MSIPELVALGVVLVAVDVWLAVWLVRNVRPPDDRTSAP